MKKTLTGASVALLTFLPFAAFAHEHQAFDINGARYEFTVGSLNEPVSVDDKSGVDLRVNKVVGAAEGPVTGLEETLQVELIAGDKRKTLDLSPAYGTEGIYTAPFYPTVATTLSYRVFGDIEGTPFDYTFTCTPAGHARAEEDTSRVEVSEGVARVLKSGGFGCPVEKAAMGFPEESASVVEVRQAANERDNTIGYVALCLAAVALGMSLYRRHA